MTRVLKSLTSATCALFRGAAQGYFRQFAPSLARRVRFFAMRLPIYVFTSFGLVTMAAAADEMPSAKAEPPVAASTAPTTPTLPQEPPSARARSAETLRFDATEQEHRTYIYAGVRYRGVLMPKFLLNAVVNEGTSIYSNVVGLEVDFRTNGLSIVPALSFQEWGMRDTLFLEKGKPDTVASNWSVVNSKLMALNATVDVLWSKKLKPTLDFEYGAGVGLGVAFGQLGVNWTYFDPNGAYRTSDGRSMSPCQSEGGVSAGCTRREHSFASEAKVGGYEEKSWINGGAKPNLIPWLTPQVGLRYRPRPDVVARIGVGLALTGVWFGLSGDYGVAVVRQAQKSTVIYEE